MAYIYLHRRNDTGEVFYVGKGSGRRATKRSRRNQHWRRVVNKAGFTVEIIVRGLTDEEAYWVEPLLIEAHGGVENLTNITTGGEGLTSEQVKAQWQDPEHREKRSKDTKELWLDPEYREKISKAVKEQWQDPSHREKISKASKEMWQDPAFREKISKANKRKVKCDKCGRMIGICGLTRHQRGSRCYNPDIDS